MSARAPNKIGFEFRKVTGASYKVSQEANLQVGTDKHEFELVVSSKGYFLTVDGEELIASRQSGALTLMNCGYTRSAHDPWRHGPHRKKFHVRQLGFSTEP